MRSFRFPQRIRNARERIPPVRNVKTEASQLQDNPGCRPEQTEALYLRRRACQNNAEEGDRLEEKGNRKESPRFPWARVENPEEKTCAKSQADQPVIHLFL